MSAGCRLVSSCKPCRADHQCGNGCIPPSYPGFRQSNSTRNIVDRRIPQIAQNPTDVDVTDADRTYSGSDIPDTRVCAWFTQEAAAFWMQDDSDRTGNDTRRPSTTPTRSRPAMLTPLSFAGPATLSPRRHHSRGRSGCRTASAGFTLRIPGTGSRYAVQHDDLLVCQRSFEGELRSAHLLVASALYRSLCSIPDLWGQYSASRNGPLCAPRVGAFSTSAMTDGHEMCTVRQRPRPNSVRRWKLALSCTLHRCPAEAGTLYGSTRTVQV